MAEVSIDGAGARGALVIADKVGAKIAERAALDVDGVVRYKTTMGSLLGGAGPIGGVYPSVTVDMSDSAPRVAAVIAVQWPCPVTQVCRDVQAHIAAELLRLTGIAPARVDVAVAQIVSSEEVVTQKKGFVELPAPQLDSVQSGSSEVGETQAGDVQAGHTQAGDAQAVGDVEERSTREVV